VPAGLPSCSRLRDAASAAEDASAAEELDPRLGPDAQRDVARETADMGLGGIRGERTGEPEPRVQVLVVQREHRQPVRRPFPEPGEAEPAANHAVDRAGQGAQPVMDGASARLASVASTISP